jgi:hypothetical protein
MDFKPLLNKEPFCDCTIGIHRADEATDATGADEATDATGASCKRRRLGNVTYLNVSKAVLAAQSPFFEALFSTKVGPKVGGDSKKPEVILEVKNLEEANCLLEALFLSYSNCFEGSLMTNTSPVDILLMADKYGLSRVVDMISEYLTPGPRADPLDLAICSEVLDLPDTIGAATSTKFKGLMSAVKARLAKEFADLHYMCNTAHFIELSGGAMLYLLKSDKLSVPSENTVFFALHRWGFENIGRWPDTVRLVVLEAIKSGALRFHCLRPSFLLFISDLEFAGCTGDDQVKEAYRRAVTGAKDFHLYMNLSPATRGYLSGLKEGNRVGFKETPFGFMDLVISLPRDTKQMEFFSRRIVLDGWIFILKAAYSQKDVLTFRTSLAQNWKCPPGKTFGCLAKIRLDIRIQTSSTGTSSTGTSSTGTSSTKWTNVLDKTHSFQTAIVDPDDTRRTFIEGDVAIAAVGGNASNPHRESFDLKWKGTLCNEKTYSNIDVR